MCVHRGALADDGADSGGVGVHAVELELAVELKLAVELELAVDIEVAVEIELAGEFSKVNSPSVVSS